MVVNPGIVLSSLMRSVPSFLRKKSTRAIPSQRSALKAAIARRCTSSLFSEESSAGRTKWAPFSSRYFAS
ncbi:hypothetical protein NEPTK9_001745 [Candidatus Neptunochlamydia vexilliferae]|uniref:Uncharacterized protein n=1 Tax=Candidatus Neptunichlamydia vexilliferae TaxID=1651774 RepID=A0ABS0B1E4_9BACT|nr:hypothetical protein [Candidatus Neptunochlamydia vexilliferae]